MTTSRSVLNGTCTVTSARCARSTIVALRMVSEASFSFGITSLVSSSARTNVYVRLISSTTPSTPSNDDAVAEPERLRERDQQAGDEVARASAARRSRRSDRDHGARGEQRAGDARTCGITSSPESSATKTIALTTVRRSTR